MRNTYSRDDVQTHYGSDRPAVNVKVYTGPREAWLDWARYEPDADPRFTEEWVEEHISEQTLDSLFWLTCEFEWEMVEQDATEIFGSHVRVEQDGRSGGWAVVAGLPEIEEWDAVALAKWRRFERVARAIAADIPYQILSSVYLNDFEAWKDEEMERNGDVDVAAAIGGRL